MYVHMSVWVYATYVQGICGGQETASDFLDLELQEAVICLDWVLRTQLRSFGKNSRWFLLLSHLLSHCFPIIFLSSGWVKKSMLPSDSL